LQQVNRALGSVIVDESAVASVQDIEQALHVGHE
jgi:hypothetical protein